VTERLDLENNVRMALEESVAWSTVWLSTVSRETMGSATALNWRGRYLLLTAFHVIADLKMEELHFGFRPSGTLERRELSSSTPLSKRLQRAVNLNILEIQYDKECDLAALAVEPTIESQHPVRFIDLPRNAITPKEGNPVVCIGAQFDSLQTLGPNAVAYQRLVHWSHVVDSSDKRWLSKFDPQTDFLFTFGAAEHNKLPHGFSGAGVWGFLRDTSRLWRPNPLLAGVCVGYYNRSKLLSARRIESVVQFLDRMFPQSLSKRKAKRHSA
jgi:hypothetical protein